MKTCILAALCASVALAQTDLNTINVNPRSGTASEVRWYNSAGTYYVGLKGGTISANKVFTLPSVDGSSAQCLKTDGSAVLSFAACMAVPATLSGSSASDILTVSQSGAGYAIHVTAGDSKFDGTVKISAGAEWSLIPTYIPASVNLLQLKDSVGTARFQFDSQNASNASLADFAVGTGGSAKNLTVYGSSTLTGNVAFSGSLSGTHAQNLGTGDGPTFDTLTVSGTGTMAINRSSATNREMYFQTATVNRWGIYVNNAAESGSNAGSNFGIARYSDAGGVLTDAMTINRATGAITIAGAVTVGSCSGCGVTSVTGTSPIASSGGSTPAISCSTCVTSVTGTSPISSSGGTTPGISCSTCVTTSNTSQSLTGSITFTNSLTMGGSANMYLRTFAGALGSCAGVSDGWIGWDTTNLRLYVCSGGNVYYAQM